MPHERGPTRSRTSHGRRGARSPQRTFPGRTRTAGIFHFIIVSHSFLTPRAAQKRKQTGPR